MRNRLFRENQAKDCEEIEEMRRIFCEETDRTRRNPATGESHVDSDSGITEENTFLVRCQRILRS